MEEKNSNSEKIQKMLARAGLGARREMEYLLKAGRVTVNGEVAQLGDRALMSDTIAVDGREVAIPEASPGTCRVLAYYKPEGEVCTAKDPEGRPTVFDHLPRIGTGRWINIGRLDLNTTGLLLFTNDGDLANRLMHPSHEVEREYSVRVLGDVTEEMQRKMLTGVEIDGKKNTFDNMYFGGGEGCNKWYNVILHEGHNREVRNVFEYFGLKVSRLMRIRYGDIKLPRIMERGTYRDLGLDDVNYLRELVDLPPVDSTGIDDRAEGQRSARKSFGRGGRNERDNAHSRFSRESSGGRRFERDGRSSQRIERTWGEDSTSTERVIQTEDRKAQRGNPIGNFKSDNSEQRAFGGERRARQDRFDRNDDSRGFKKSGRFEDSRRNSDGFGGRSGDGEKRFGGYGRDSDNRRGSDADSRFERRGDRYSDSRFERRGSRDSDSRFDRRGGRDSDSRFDRRGGRDADSRFERRGNRDCDSRSERSGGRDSDSRRDGRRSDRGGYANRDRSSERSRRDGGSGSWNRR